MLIHFTKTQNLYENQGNNSPDAMQKRYGSWQNNKLRAVALALFVILLGSSTQAFSQAQNLSAMFPFNGNATDQTGNFTTTPNNLANVPDRFGNADHAVEFDGTNTYIDAGTTFNPASIFSISLWIKRSRSGVQETIIAKYSDTGCSQDNRQFRWQFNDNGTLGFVQYGTLTGGNYRWIEGNTVINDNEWHHVALSYSYSADPLVMVKMWVDGNLQTNSLKGQTGGHAEMKSGTARLGIGAVLNSAGGVCNTGILFQGAMDDLVFYSRTFTSEDIEYFSAEKELKLLSLDKYKLILNRNFTTQTVQAEALPSGTYTYGIHPASVPFANISMDANTGLLTIESVADQEGFQSFDFFAVTGTDTVRTKFTLDINSIISRVTFDEGTISGTPQPAVFTNTGTTAANDRFGRANHARMFNNTRLYSTMSSPALTNEFSASVWIYPTTTLNANTSVNQFFLYMTTVMDLGYQSGNLKLRLYDGSGNIMNYSMPITMAGFKWHHIIVISEPGQNVKFIVNGQETQLTASPATLYQHSSPQFSIGDFTGGNNPFYGVIDEVNLYNRVFTQKEMSDFSAKPIANVNISDNLLLDLTLDGTLEDLSGNTNHFSVVNGTEIYSEGRFGTPDSSFVFGSSKYLSLGGTEAADLQIPANYTLNMWVKTATTTDQYLYSKGGTSDNVALTTRINANGSVSVANKYAIYANETCPCYTSTITSSHTGLNDGQWHMLTFARTGSATRIFVDGQFSVETSDQYAQYSQTNNWGILIGRNRSASGTEFSGELDNVRFYNRMLTPEDIDALYQVTPSHANTAPALTGTFPEMNVNEDSEEFVVARLDTMVTDADNQPISFSVNSSDENLFTVRIETGHIYLQPAANAYGTGYLQIVAYDQTDSATFDALVTINELNDIPSFNYSKYKVVLSPQSPDQLLTISMNQPSNEANQALTYSISPDPANQQTFSITLNETTGELTVGPGSVPQADTLSFTITVNDGEALNNTYEREVEFIMLSDEFNGLIAHYDFNGNANNVNPLTIGQFDGTVTSSVLANDRLNNPNSAYYFEGTGDYITIANAPEFNFDTDKDYSISLWMRTPYGTTNRMMVDKGNNPRYYVGMGTDGKLIGSIEYGGSNGVHIYSPNRMDDNSWHHIALTVDRDSVMALYVDGEMVASDTLTISGTISTTYGMRFGALSDIANQWNYNGYLDDIRIFNRVISPNEVSVFSDENRPTFLEPVNSAFKQNSIISATDTFRVSFNQDLNPASVANIQVFGSHTGKISGTASANGNTIEFVPSNSYQVGERITFHLPKSVVAASGDTLKRDYWSVNHVKAQNRAHENPMEFYEAGIIDDVVSTFNYAVPSDIDGDGDADVVGVSGGEGKLSLYVNNGSGTFTATELTPPAGSIQYVNVADLTNDGLSDILLIVNFTAYWLKNNGSLNFDAPVSLGTLSTLYNGLQYSILAADIDGDGDQDVIPYSLSSQQGWFYIINNTNAGASFGTPYLYASTNGMGLTVGDLNGDGKAEIVSITQTSIVSYTMSNAASTNIQSTTLYGFPNNYGNFPQGYGFGGDIADMDGDGDNDLIVGSWGTTGANSKVFMLRNNNGFISNSPENIIDFGVNTNTQVNAVKAADVDSDGDLDIVGYGTYSKLYWIENFGNNLYSPSKPISAALTPQSYRHEFPGFADFNNDNYLDVLASGANSFRWFTSSDNLSNTGYTPANYAANVSSESNIELHFDLELNPATAINANFYVHGSFTGKISGSLALTNGNKTLVFNPDTNFTQGEVIEWALSSQLTSVNAKNAKSMSGQFTVTYTKGDNNFYEVYRYDRYNNQEWNEVAAGDFDNDNKIDFDGFAYMTYPTAIYFETFKNTGNGAFSATTDNDGTYAALSNTKYKLFDFNNDGRIDRFYNWRNYARISGMSSNANGSFGAGVDLVSLSYTNDFSFGDVDNDGDADAVLATDYGIERHLNNGNATFTKTTDVLVNQIIVNIQLADMNADGKSDIVYWDGNNNFKFYFNDNGSFTRVASITNNTYSNVKDWAFSDFNADGYTDFVVTRSTNQGVSLFKNNGDGTFTVEDLHAGVTNANKVKVIDLNTDGKPDVLANISGNALVFYANEGNSFAPADTLMNTSSLYDFELADTDNDGDMDIIAGLNHAYAVYSNGLPPNNAPTVVNTVANLSMVEDAADTLWVADVATLFTDADADALTYNVSSDTSAVAASLVQGANGMELHVSLMANYFGTANIEIEAKDWQDSVSTSFVVDVAAVNDSPEFQLSMSSLTVDEDFSHTVIDIYSAHPENESDQTVVYTITNNVTFANVTLSGNEIHIDSIADQFGSGTFTLTADDGQATDSLYSVDFTLTVNAIDDLPAISFSGDVSMDEDFANDTSFVFTTTHPENEEQTLVYTLSPEMVDFATIELDTVNGKVMVSPVSDGFGAQKFTLSVTDGVNTSSADFTLTVNAVNDAPEFELSQSFANIGKNFANPIVVSASQMSPANESDQVVTYNIDPTSVTFADIAFDVATGQLTITAITDGVGSQIFTITADDGQGADNTATGTFELNVLNNQPPVVANAIADVTMNEDDAAFEVLTDVSAVFTDPENDALTYSVSSDNASVLAELNGSMLVVTPQANFNGVANITLRAEDGNSFGEEVFLVTVNAVNDSPVASSTTVSESTDEDAPFTSTTDFNTLFSDADGDDLTLSLVEMNPSETPQTWLNLSNVFATGTPSQVQVGVNHFYVIASDGIGSDTIEYHVTVNNVNDPPVFTSTISNAVLEEDAAAFAHVPDLNTVFSDEDGDVLQFSAESTNAGIIPQLEGNSLVVSLAADFNGNGDITVFAFDATDTASFTYNVQVNSVNDAPIFTLSESVVQLAQDFADAHTITATPGNVPNDEANQQVSYSLIPTSISFANVSVDANTGQVTISSIAGQFGTQVFEVMASDGSEMNGTHVQTFELQVQRANNAPTDITLSVSEVAENNDLNNSFIATLGTIDADNDAASFELVAGDGSEDNASFTVSFMGNAKKSTQAGSNYGLFANAVFDFETKNVYKIRLRANDGFGATFEKAVEISITNVNEAPENLVLSSDTIQEGKAVGTTIGTLSVSDVDANDTHTFTLVTGGFGNDNAKFNINGNTLVSNEVFDFEVKNSYSILVQAADAAGLTTVNSFTISIKNVVEAGIADLQLRYQLKVYPNPVVDYVTISGSMQQGAVASISLVDMFGRTMLSAENVEGEWVKEIDMSAFARGTYFIKIESNGEYQSIPVVRK